MADRDGRPVDALPLPTPPLVDRRAGVALRPWADHDAPALAAAWAVPDVAAQATVPGEGSVADSARWVAGAEARRETGLALDLVVGPVDGDEVWGEVGLARRVFTAGDRRRPEHEVGWWVLPAHRGRGVATAAARLLVGWALTSSHEGADEGLGLARVVARIERGAVASEAVATRAGLRRLGTLDPTRDLWATVL